MVLQTPKKAPASEGRGLYKSLVFIFSMSGIPYEIRTRVAAVKGRCPRPLDERDNYIN